MTTFGSQSLKLIFVYYYIVKYFLNSLKNTSIFLAPRFTQGPKVLQQDLTIGSEITLYGCKLEIPAHIDTSQISSFYLKNGYKLLSSYSLLTRNATVEDGGYYQCMIRLPGYPDILSDPVDVRFKGKTNN